MAGIVRHRQLKGSVTNRSHLNHRATPRLYKSGFFKFPVTRLAFHLSSDTPKSELLLAKPEHDSSAEPEIVLSVI